MGLHWDVLSWHGLLEAPRAAPATGRRGPVLERIPPAPLAHSFAGGPPPLRTRRPRQRPAGIGRRPPPRPARG